MKRQERVCSVLFIIVITLALAISCNSQPTEEKGQVTISIKDTFSRAIEPNISFDVSRYSIHATGPNGSSFSFDLDYSNSTYTNNNVIPGEWIFQAIAYNEDDIAIGEGSCSITVVPRQTTDVVITVYEYSGTGTFTITLSGATPDFATYTAHINKVENGVLVELDSKPFSINENILTVSFNLTNGFYTYQIRCSNSNITLHAPEAFRIVTGDSISVEYQVNDKGNISGKIINKIDPNPTLSITLNDTQVIVGESVIATANMTTPGSYVYKWYIDGKEESSTEDTLELLFEKAGNYTLSCLVVDSTSSIVWSEKKNLTVTDQRMNIVSFYDGDSLIETRSCIPNSDCSFPIFSLEEERSEYLTFNGWRRSGTAEILSPTQFFSLPLSTTEYRYDVMLSSEYLDVDSNGNIYSLTLNDTNAESLIIPSVLNGKDVTGIKENGFENHTKLKIVSIPESVITIGDSAFRNCTAIISTDLGDSITSIGNGSFYNCSALTSVTIPNSVISIGYNAFNECRSLSSVIIGEGVMDIGSSAFCNCSSLTSITLPDSVKSIGNATFYRCYSLKDIDLSHNLDTISGSAFCGCSSLTNINIPYGVKTIAVSAFFDCINLKSVNIPSSVTSIAYDSFGGQGDTIIMFVDKPIGSLLNSPWGADKYDSQGKELKKRATIHWLDDVEEYYK